METWKDIKGHEGFYKVSTKGKVMSYPRPWTKGKEIKPHLNHKGYYHLSFANSSNDKRKKYFIHRLVAQTFIPNPENKPEVNHKDCNKLNNNVENLEWVTHKDNVKHAKKNNRYVRKLGSKHHLSKLNEKQVLEILEKRHKKQHKEIAKEYGVSLFTIKSIYAGKNWSHLTNIN